MFSWSNNDPPPYDRRGSRGSDDKRAISRAEHLNSLLNDPVLKPSTRKVSRGKEVIYINLLYGIFHRIRKSFWIRFRDIMKLIICFIIPDSNPKICFLYLVPRFSLSLSQMTQPTTQSSKQKMKML